MCIPTVSVKPILEVDTSTETEWATTRRQLIKTNAQIELLSPAYMRFMAGEAVTLSRNLDAYTDTESS